MNHDTLSIINQMEENLLHEYIDDKDVYSLIESVRKGIKFDIFQKIVNEGPFTLDDWAGLLHLSLRTIQRYKKEKKDFDSIHSEKIIEIMLLVKYGAEVFGSVDSFRTWLHAKNVAMGGVIPNDLLDSTFGIRLVHDELTRIEHGVLA